MKYIEIFQDVRNVMLNDASCCKDKKGADPESFLAQISEDMPEKDFLLLMKTYLASFGLTGHLSFRDTRMGQISFEVKRYENSLYVTKTSASCGLQIGDRIVKVDGMTIKEVSEKYASFLYGETDERQAPFWPGILAFAAEMTVVRKQSKEQEQIPVRLEEEPQMDDAYSCRTLGEDITYIRLPDFCREQTIRKMYDDNEEIIGKCKYLICDVRGNKGGSDTAFLPLLPYILPEGKTIDDFPSDSDFGQEMNYSVRNCDSRLSVLHSFFEGGVIPEEVKSYEESLHKLRGKGFVKDEGCELEIYGLRNPQKVFLITDESCASSGDSFVEIMKCSPKVTVVGRPTRGILDYSNCSEIDYDYYRLLYPTSRRIAIDHGIEMMHHGIPVDEYISWTPGHLERDVDLERVLELIRNMESE